MKNRTFLDSIKCALSGIRYGFKSEKNFKYYIIIALIFLIINIFCRIESYGYLVYITACVGVFSAEFINTSIEKLCDKLSSEISEDIKIIKDIAAAGVVIWGFLFFITEIFLIGNRLICS